MYFAYIIDTLIPLLYKILSLEKIIEAVYRITSIFKNALKFCREFDLNAGTLKFSSAYRRKAI